MARVGAGKVAAGDPRVGRQCAALIGSQHLAFPFRRPAVAGVSRARGTATREYHVPA